MSCSIELLSVCCCMDSVWPFPGNVESIKNHEVQTVWPFAGLLL